jgi:oligogalacturonide transporter
VGKILDKKLKTHDGWDEYRNKRIYRAKKNIGFWRSIGFGVFSSYSQAMQGMVVTWLLFFYTNFCGLSAVEGASIFAIGRVIDAFTTLLAGNISDKFYKFKIGRRFGRRHFFIFLAAPASLLAITQWVPDMNYLYYLLTYLFTNMFLSFLEIPYDTLSNEMTKDYNQRTKLSTSRMVFAGAFAPVIQWVIAQMFKMWPKSSPIPYITAQTIFSAGAFVLILITYFTTWEHFVTKEEAAIEASHAQQHKNVWHLFVAAVKNYLSTFKIKAFRIHLLIFGSSYLAASVWGTVFAYYIIDVMGLSSSTAAYLSMFSLVSIPVTIIAGWAITKISPRALYMFAYLPILVACAATAAIAFIRPPHVIIWLSITCFLYNIGQYILWFIPWNVFPFLPDIDTVVTGENRSGVFASVMMFIMQTFIALGTIIVGLLLDASGFIQSKTGTLTQPTSAKLTIISIISIVVGILIIIAMLGAFKFKVTRQSSEVINTEVARLRAGGKMSETKPEVKAVITDLSGVPFDDIKVWHK